MPPDVAGATFMAAGSSAPELATAVIGVFVAQVGPSSCLFRVSDNDYSLIIDIYFYDTFSTLTQTFSACNQLFRHPVWC